MFAMKSRFVALKTIRHQTSIHDHQRQHGPDKTLTNMGKLGSAMLISQCSKRGTVLLAKSNDLLKHDTGAFITVSKKSNI